MNVHCASCGMPIIFDGVIFPFLHEDKRLDPYHRVLAISTLEVTCTIQGEVLEVTDSIILK